MAVTTHLAAWITRKGVYFPRARPHLRERAQAVPWHESPRGQHVELGIAEHNLFLALGALGLARELSGVTLLPIGTLYDPFVTRGLDALYHALYSGARFVVAATPSGVSLSPEGGAHQSVITPGIGVALPAIRYFDPGSRRRWSGSFSTRSAGSTATGESLYSASRPPVEQSLAPPPTPDTARVLRGGYRLMDARTEAGYDPEDTRSTCSPRG